MMGYSGCGNISDYSCVTTFGNESANFTSPAENELNYKPQVTLIEVVFETIGLSTISVCGSVTNFVLVYLYIKYPSAHSSAASYIMNLTVVDLISCTIIIPLIIYGIMIPAWTHGPAMCLVANALVSIPYCVSFWGHLGLTVCRYCLFDFKSKICKVLLKQTSIITVIILMWLFNIALHWLLLWSPYPMAKVQFVPQYGICAIHTAESEGYIVVTTVLTMTVLGPFFVCLTLYMIIAYRIHRQAHTFPSQLAKHRFLQMSKYTTLLFGFFSLFWLPDYLMLTFNVNQQAPVWFTRLCYFLYYLNGAVNPYIYALRCEPVRKAFKKEFPRLAFLFKNSSNQVAPLPLAAGPSGQQGPSSSQRVLVPRSAIVTLSHM